MKRHHNNHQESSPSSTVVEEQNEEEEEEDERGAARPPAPPPCPLQGDLLESVVSRLSLLDLLPASHVSSTWRRTVSSSLPRRLLKPFLLLHLFPRGRSNAAPTTSLFYDPTSRVWAPLISSASNAPPTCLYLLSSAWPGRLPPPRVPRIDPVVALVGPSTLVVAGSSCSDTCGTVETLDLSGSSAACWSPAAPLPSPFLQSASATWLSAATSDSRLYLLAKDSGCFSAFDPLSNEWSRTCQLKPDPTISVSAIGYLNGRLVLAGLSGSDTLRVWEVGLDPDSEPVGFREIGRMPDPMVERLTGWGFGSMTTIGLGLSGDFGYLYNPAPGCFSSEGAVFWDFKNGAWESVSCPQQVEDDPTARIVFVCARLQLDHLRDLYKNNVI